MCSTIRFKGKNVIYSVFLGVFCRFVALKYLKFKIEKNMKKGLKVVLIGALVCGLSSIVMARNNNACEIPTDIQERYDMFKANIKDKSKKVDFEKNIAKYWGGYWYNNEFFVKGYEPPYLYSDCDVLEKAYREAYQRVYDSLLETNDEEKLYNEIQGRIYEMDILKKAKSEIKN